ncbi:hypothetical protein F7725_010268 [Dissostichus mawsoni]|uniref:Nuclease HARBI1 n=1 Tax=Dissostichus mawsoni TaxID=36200 RepID=A0A7J5XNC7_DISMA|nr:hypothetical protein F7725_010268 [Dissostichus mawsoni]
MVFLFWLASGASCRVVSRVFGMPRSTEVVAIRHQVIHLPGQQKTWRLCRIITACAVLHNICIGAGDIMAPEEAMLRNINLGHT